MTPKNVHVVDHCFNCATEEVYYLENVDPNFRTKFETILDNINNYFDYLFDILENDLDEDSHLTRYLLTNTAGKQETAKIALAYAYHLTTRHDGDPFKAWEWGLSGFENYFLTMRSGFEKLDFTKVLPIIDRLTKTLINQKLTLTPSWFMQLNHFDKYIGDLSKTIDDLKKITRKNFLSRWAFRNENQEIDNALESIVSLRLILDPVGNPSIDNWKKYEEFIKSETISQYDFATTKAMIKDHAAFKSSLDNKTSSLRRQVGRIKYNLGL